MKYKNPVVTETLRIFVGHAICLGLMLGVYALIGKFSTSVLIGGIVGTVLAVGNFFFLAIGLSNLSDDAADPRVRLRAQSSYLIRTVIMIGLAAVAIKFGGCDVIATLLPLLLMRPILMVEQFILRSSSANAVCADTVASSGEGDGEESEEKSEEKEEPPYES